ADAMEVAIEWEILRQEQAACGALDDPTRDINHNGCLDVADMQLVAAHYGPLTPQTVPLPQNLFLPLVISGPDIGDDTGLVPTQTWTVNSTTDQSDSSIGNGICSA